MTRILASILLLFAVDDDPPQQPRAPADYQIISSDRAGAYFVARPLKERYDRALGELATLRREIDGALISTQDARAQLQRLSEALKGLKDQIERAKVYIPGAQVHRATSVESFPIDGDAFLLVDAPHLEIRGWDRPDVRCEVEKTILSPDIQGVEKDIDGITIEHEQVSSRQVFGFYHDTEGKPEWKREWDRFAFREFLGRNFHHIRVVGLDSDRGNRQITVSAKNEEGAGSMSSQWRRQAKLILYVPACGRIGVRGALAGFKVDGVEAHLSVMGQGDRDYQATYEIANHTGSFAAESMTIHRLDGVKGDVQIRSTGHDGNASTAHDDRGVTMEPGPVRSAEYRGIEGNLTVRLLRNDLTLDRIAGRIDVVNEFGRTTWNADKPISHHAHRILSEYGTITVRLPQAALEGLPITILTECGIIQLATTTQQDLELWDVSESYPWRSWRGFKVAQVQDKIRDLASHRFEGAWEGRDRPPGVDILNRAGTIRILPPGQ